MAKHVHAELMAEYAKDAMETDKPWERWEYFNGLYWSQLKALGECHPSWNKDNQYRRKPNGKVVVIDGKEFIVPKSFKPERGDFYFVIDVHEKYTTHVTCENDHYDGAKLGAGACYKTEEEAEQALKFWQAINEA